MKVFYFIIQVLPISLCYDDELEAILRLSDDLLNKMNNDLPASHREKATESPFVNRVRLNDADTSINQRSEQAEKPSTVEEFQYMSQVYDCMGHIKSIGLDRLDSLLSIVKNDLKINKDISALVRNVSNDYSSKISSYVYAVPKNASNLDLDVEFLFLDLVETSNKLSFSLQRKVFHQLVDDDDSLVLKYNAMKATEKIYKDSVLDKRNDMEYICEKYDICRQYPGFTDYFSDSISEILKIPNDKLYTIMKIIKRLIKIKIVFFSQIIHREAMKAISLKSHSLTTNLWYTREFFSILRSIITHRHKMRHDNVDHVLKRRTKAVKILLDIVDKAMGNEGEEMVAMNFNILVNGVRSWAVGVRQDIDKILILFVNYFVDSLKANLSYEAMKEMRILTEVILKGTWENNSLFKHLFSKGSKFVRGEDVQITNNFL